MIDNCQYTWATLSRSFQDAAAAPYFDKWALPYKMAAKSARIYGGSSRPLNSPGYRVGVNNVPPDIIYW